MKENSKFEMSIKIVPGDYRNPKCANMISCLYARCCFWIGCRFMWQYYKWCKKHSEIIILKSPTKSSSRTKRKKKGDK